MKFVDTNVLLYAISRDKSEEKKARRAGEILEEKGLALSVQVLQEFYVQATHESRSDSLSHAQAFGLVEAFMRFDVQESTAQIMLGAMQARDRFQISYWDAAIVEAARVKGCDIVFSEDLNDGQDYGGVRVVNPFADI